MISSVKSFTKIYSIRAPVREVWQALTDPKKIDAWGGGPAKMEPKAGTKFTLWGGDIHGTNTKVVPEKILMQDWFSGDWPEPSKVTFTLTGKAYTTEVKLTHTDIPDDEFSDIKSGWDDYYLEPLKTLLEKK